MTFSSVVLDKKQGSTAVATGAVVAHVLSRPIGFGSERRPPPRSQVAFGVALLVGAMTGLRQEGESFRSVTIGFVCAGGFALSVWLSVSPHDGNRKKVDETPGS